MPEPLPITSVNHVAHLTHHVEATRDFYRDVLGFREVECPNFDSPGAWLFNYGIMIHLIYSEAADAPKDEIETHSEHLALNTDDLPKVERLLSEHGVPYLKTVVSDRKIRQIIFRDPDGHHIEVATYPPTPPYVAVQHSLCAS